LKVKIKLKNEERIYMGPKGARVPRGARVKLIAVINGKRGVFEYDGERFIVPVRILHRIRTPAPSTVCGLLRGQHSKRNRSRAVKAPSRPAHGGGDRRCEDWTGR